MLGLKNKNKKILEQRAKAFFKNVKMIGKIVKNHVLFTA